MEPIIITADTPLFMLAVRDRQEGRYSFLLFRHEPSPHIYEWRSLLMEWDGRPNAEDRERFEQVYEQRCKDYERWKQLYKQRGFKDEKEEREAEWRKFAPISGCDSKQGDEQDFLERQCFTIDEVEVIEAHVQMLGYQSERTPVGLPMGNCIASDCCGNVWQYRDFWEEGALPCSIRYHGFFGIETQLIPLPEDYFDISIRLTDGEAKVQLPLWEIESEGESGDSHKDQH